MAPPNPLPFNDLNAQHRRIAPGIERALRQVLEHGRFIMGPEVARLETLLAEFCGARQAISCGSGTEALQLALMALNIGSGDAVIVPAFTFAATAEAVVLVGATPVFVDIEDYYGMIDPLKIEQGIDLARNLGLRPRAIMAVDLFGQPASHGEINAVAERHQMNLIADAAQSFGASLDGVPVGRLAPITVTSFFPAKPLGCYGDGGAVFTDDEALAGILRSLREHGQGATRYEHERVGLNSRLDTMQAAVLLEKLAIFPDEIERRKQAASAYTAALCDIVETPLLREGAQSVWAQYTIRVPRREQVASQLLAVGIPTAVHYPRPVPRQPAYQGFPVANSGISVAEKWSEKVLSLPMHAYLEPEIQQRIIAAVRSAVRT